MELVLRGGCELGVRALSNLFTIESGNQNFTTTREQKLLQPGNKNFIQSGNQIFTTTREQKLYYNQ